MTVVFCPWTVKRIFAVWFWFRILAYIQIIREADTVTFSLFTITYYFQKSI